MLKRHDRSKRGYRIAGQPERVERFRNRNYDHGHSAQNGQHKRAGVLVCPVRERIGDDAGSEAVRDAKNGDTKAGDDGGEVVAQGTPEQIVRNPRSPP